MKKLIVFIVVFGALGGGYYALRSVRLDFAWEKGETAKSFRGNVVRPINATGPIGPLSRHEIKSEASGEVEEIFHQPGDLVRKGDLLIRLNKDDEQRTVDRATADVTRTSAALESARIKEQRLRKVGIKQAELRIEQIQAQLGFAAFNRDKVQRLQEGDASSPDELQRVGANYDELLARRKLADADLEDANIAIDLAAQDIILAQAAHDQANTALGDARKRLAKTQVYCPIDGMVVDLNIQVGEVIQGGKTTFTGGTVLVVVANVSKIYVRAEVDEADIGTVCELVDDWAKPGHQRRATGDVTREPGTPVKVHVESFPDEEFTGVIELIHPEPANKASALVTYQVDIVITSENRHKLLTGMQADVEFAAQSATDVVLVPQESIKINESGERGVYVPVTDAETGEIDKKFVKCKTGLDNGMYVEIVEGLDEGTTIFTKPPRKTNEDEDSE